MMHNEENGIKTNERRIVLVGEEIRRMEEFRFLFELVTLDNESGIQVVCSDMLYVTVSVTSKGGCPAASA